MAKSKVLTINLLSYHILMFLFCVIYGEPRERQGNITNTSRQCLICAAILSFFYQKILHSMKESSDDGEKV